MSRVQFKQKKIPASPVQKPPLTSHVEEFYSAPLSTMKSLGKICMSFHAGIMGKKQYWS